MERWREGEMERWRGREGERERVRGGERALREGERTEGERESTYCSSRVFPFVFLSVFFSFCAVQ